MFNAALRNLAHSTMITAIEGGISYWCQLDRYRWYGLNRDGSRAMGELGDQYLIRVLPVKAHRLNDEESGYVRKGVPVSAADLLRAMVKLATDPKFPAHLRQRAAGWLVAPDDADLDSDAADVVFQVAALGEIVYG